MHMYIHVNVYIYIHIWHNLHSFIHWLMNTGCLCILDIVNIWSVLFEPWWCPVHLFNCFISCVCVQLVNRVLLCNIMDCSPPGSFVHGIFQARVLEQVAISSSRGSSWPRDRTCLSCISYMDRQLLYHCVSSLTHLLLHYAFLEGSMSDSCDPHSSVPDPRRELSTWFQLGGCSEAIPISFSGGGHQIQARQKKKLSLL